ncbi:addiction module protein [Microbacterium lushaniae]|uniref:Addiction module protein n=2 Tax=Microbacterium lushaniae TaxID=2614639 RepID=A0A5J6L5E7_9MICO|nr:addiction module protein [Microbacterium lushaniae]
MLRAAMTSATVVRLAPVRRIPAVVAVGPRSYTRCMALDLNEYIEAGYALTPAERLEAARALQLSVDQDTDERQPEIDAAWEDEIDRRLDEFKRGEAVLVDGREGLAAIRDELAARVR